MAKIAKVDLPTYPVRVIAAGSRRYGDYVTFSKVINDFILANKLTPDTTVFLSGLAKGPDKFIVKWCTQHKWNYCEFPADWKDTSHPGAVIRRNDIGELYDAIAGLRRNIEMAENATHLVAFWDHKSTGTKHMIDMGAKYHLHVHLFKI